jgi:hypothetical protein
MVHRSTLKSTTRPRQYVNGPSGKTQLTSATVGTFSPSNVLYSPNEPSHGVSTTALPTMRGRFGAVPAQAILSA